MSSMSKSDASNCGTNLRMVNAKYIFEETLNTKFNHTNGEPFLNDFFDHTRFIVQPEKHCVNACLR